MKKIADLDGPIGKDGTPDDKRYERSSDWKSLENSDEHHNNLVSSATDNYSSLCRPTGLFDLTILHLYVF